MDALRKNSMFDSLHFSSLYVLYHGIFIQSIERRTVMDYMMDCANMERYTATVYFRGTEQHSNSHNDLNKLTAYLLNFIETESPNASGEIFDNLLGRVIQRCRKSAFD